MTNNSTYLRVLIFIGHPVNIYHASRTYPSPEMMKTLRISEIFCRTRIVCNPYRGVMLRKRLISGLAASEQNSRAPCFRWPWDILCCTTDVQYADGKGILRGHVVIRKISCVWYSPVATHVGSERLVRLHQWGQRWALSPDLYPSTIRVSDIRWSISAMRNSSTNIML